MTILDGLREIESAFPVFSCSYSGCLRAMLDGMPFDHDGMEHRRKLHNILCQNIEEFLEQFPELEEHDRQIVCDLQMSPIRAHILQTKREFDCYREIMDRWTVSTSQAQ